MPVIALFVIVLLLSFFGSLFLLFFLLDCFASLAMTKGKVLLSLRGAVRRRGNPVFFSFIPWGASLVNPTLSRPTAGPRKMRCILWVSPGAGKVPLHWRGVHRTGW